MNANVVDPVCKMQIDPKKAQERITYQGETYYLCSEPCAEQFQANPGRFVEKAS